MYLDGVSITLRKKLIKIKTNLLMKDLSELMAIGHESIHTRLLGISAQKIPQKLDLALNDEYIIELFSFPNPPARPSRPESSGLRHLAFSVNNIQESVAALTAKGVELEPIRIDEFTQKKFTFFTDPDGLPIELYELG